MGRKEGKEEEKEERGRMRGRGREKRGTRRWGNRRVGDIRVVKYEWGVREVRGMEVSRAIGSLLGVGGGGQKSIRI